MPVLDKNELEQSPLADLHAIASELGIEGYRRLRREDLIEALLSGEAPSSEPKRSSEDEPSSDDRPRRRRGGRGRGKARDEDSGETGDSDGDERPARSRGGRSRPKREERPARAERAERDDADDEPEVEGEPRSGVLDILPNGSGFMRVALFQHSDEDVYVSPAQIRRCELRAGDELTGPVRPPRRSERHPSLVRVDKVNDGEPEPPVERPGFDDLTPVFAKQKLAGLGDVPFGRGSRVAIGGPPGAGVTSMLRGAVEEIKKESDIELVVLLIGARPEEVTEWQRLDGVTVAGGAFDKSIEEQTQIADLAVERAKRVVERGGHAALVVDSLDALSPAAARRVFGAARSVEQGGSLTVLAATGLAGEPQRVATTRVLLEPGGKINEGSGTLRAELLS